VAVKSHGKAQQDHSMTSPGARPEAADESGSAAGVPVPEAPYLTFDDIIVDVQGHRIWRKGEPRHLPPRTFATLLTLVRHPRELVDRQALMEAVWPGSFVTDNALSRCIKEVRQVLGDPARAPRYIETVPRVGYRFLGEVTALDSFDPTVTKLDGAAEPKAGSPGDDIASSPTEAAKRLTRHRSGPVRLWAGAFLVILLAGMLVFFDNREPRETLEENLTGSVDPELGSAAYLEYVQGRELLNQRSEAERRRAVQHFRTAIELEPGYANAWSGLADALISLGTFLPPRAVLSDAMDAIRQALTLNPDNAAARLSLARLEAEYRWDFEQAETEFRRALQLQPDFLPAYLEYAIFLVFRGREEEALTQLDQAVAIDPLAPAPGAIRGWVLLMLGRVGEARVELEEALALDPRLVITHLNLGLLALREERPAGAVEAFSRALEFAGPSPDIEGLLGYAEARSGRASEARIRLAELMQRSETQYVPPISMAMIHLGLGEQQDAIRQLRAGYGDRNWHLIMLREHFLFDSLRGSEGFESLVAAVELGGQRDTSSG
jgi:DNA-binding winged helix-turn-helix (wHTH) protein/Flp pilus assembly protein TadD